MGLTIEDFTAMQNDWLKMAISICADKNQAFDLLQDVYVKLLEIQTADGHLDRFAYNGSPNTFFIYTLLKNQFIDIKRESKRFPKTTLSGLELEDITSNGLSILEAQLLKHDQVCDILTRLCFEGDENDKYHLTHFMHTVIIGKPISEYSNEIGLSYATINNSVKKIKQHIKVEIMSTRKKKTSNQKKKAASQAKTQTPSNGLGDVVEKVLKSPPIKPITDALKKIIWKEGEDCGCDKRKEQLNKIWRSPRIKAKFMSEQQYHLWSAFRERPNKQKIERHQINMVDKFYSELTGTTFRQSSITLGCASCARSINNKIDGIEKVYLTHVVKEIN